MRIVIEDAKSESVAESPSLDSMLAKQFAQIKQQLMALANRPISNGQGPVLQVLRQQQDRLVSAMEQLVQSIRKTSHPSDELVKAIQTMQSSMHERPSTEMNFQPLLDRLDGLQTAMMQGLRKSRSRTFGSNY